MRIDCHTHTRAHSDCSVLEPDMLCQLALERGLDGVVITEHRVQWPAADIRALRKRHPSLRVYAGMEVSLLEGYDVVLISEARLPSFGFPTLGQLDKALAPIRDEVFCFVAHPFRYTDELPDQLAAIMEYVDAIELNSVNIMRNNATRENGSFLPRNFRLYEQASRRFGLKPVFNTDCHHPAAVAAVANDLGGQKLPFGEGELVECLQRAKPAQYQNPGLLSTLFR